MSTNRIILNGEVPLIGQQKRQLDCPPMDADLTQFIASLPQDQNFIAGQLFAMQVQSLRWMAVIGSKLVKLEETLAKAEKGNG